MPTPRSARALLLPFLVWLLLPLPSGLAGQERGMSPEDYYRLVTVGEAVVSPGGDLVAFTVTRVMEEENTRHREIWMQVIRNGEPVGSSFRFTDPSRDSSSPRWSPDGSLLAFSSARGNGEGSVHFLRVGPPGGEAFQIEGVRGTPRWSRDGAWIAFTAAPPREDLAPQREGWIAPDAVTNTLSSDRFDGRVITSSRYKSDGVLTFRPHFSLRPRNQLWVVPAEGGEARQLTDLPFDVGAVEWSADGTRLFFTGNERQDDELSPLLTTALWTVPFDGGPPRQVTPTPGNAASPSLSPDGTRLAYSWTPERGAQTVLMVAELDGQGGMADAPRTLTADFDLPAAGAWWSADGRHLHFSTGIRGNSHLFRVPAAGGGVAQITEGERRLSSFSLSADDGVMAFVASDAATPAELHLSRGDGSREVRVTDFNDVLLSELTLKSAEEVLWRVSDGTEIQGWVIPPVEVRPGERYPLILKIHGGPHSAYGNVFFPTFHVLSAGGFYVFYPNPRGSSEYGHTFQYATLGAWGEVDSEDFLTGVDAVVERYPQVDPERVGVSGGSYGGFMTNWLTSTTDRFAAAVTSRSITNWESWYGTSDAQGLTEFEFFGTPWEERERYRRLSPISYVENVTAPTLIIHSENDYRTPIADGEQWFMALKKLGTPTELVRYPRSSHGLSRTGEPWLLVDRLERIRSWFAHWLVENPQRRTAIQDR